MYSMFQTKPSSIFTPEAVYDSVADNKRRFIGVFLCTLLGTYGLFYAIDFLPEPPEEQSAAVADSSNDDSVTDDDAAESEEEIADIDDGLEDNTGPASDASAAALPVRMKIDALDREIPILNPTARSIPELDAALERGAVRHPDAADFQREGNIFVLGHSSRLPNVINRNFQIFNGIEDLQWGDVIRVYSEDTEYIYRVDRVYEAKASSLTVPIADTGPRLTLATCDSFGSIDDRFIVEAELQSSRPISDG